MILPVLLKYKYFLNEKSNSTTISIEYPEVFEIGKNERYYPIPKEGNQNAFEIMSEKHNLYKM